MQEKKSIVAEITEELDRGRETLQTAGLGQAYKAFSLADQVVPLAVEDLELLAMAAYLVGRDEEYLRALERAHNAHLNAGENVRAVRCAFWLGFRLLIRGEMGRATGWLARAQRLMERGARVRRARISVAAGRRAAP